MSLNVIAVDAEIKRMVDTYEANEARFFLEYKNMPLEKTGFVESIKAWDFVYSQYNYIRITVDGSEIQCQTDDSKSAALLNKGDKIQFRGTVSTVTLGTLRLTKCTFLLLPQEKIKPGLSESGNAIDAIANKQLEKDSGSNDSKQNKINVNPTSPGTSRRSLNDEPIHSIPFSNENINILISHWSQQNNTYQDRPKIDCTSKKSLNQIICSKKRLAELESALRRQRNYNEEREPSGVVDREPFISKYGSECVDEQCIWRVMSKIWFSTNFDTPNLPTMKQ